MNISSSKKSPNSKTLKVPRTLRLLEKNGKLALDVNQDSRIGRRDLMLSREVEGEPWSENQILPVTRQDLERWDKDGDGVLMPPEFPDSLRMGSSRVNDYATQNRLSYSLALDKGTLSAEWTPDRFGTKETIGYGAFMSSLGAGCGLGLAHMFGGNYLVGASVGGSLALAFAGFTLHHATVNPAIPSIVPHSASTRAALI